MSAHLLNLLLFSAQAALIVIVGGLALELMRSASPRVRLLMLRALMAVAILSPFVGSPTATVDGSTVTTQLTLLSSVRPGAQTPIVATAWPWNLVVAIAVVLVLGSLVRMVVMIAGVRRLSRLAKHGTPVTIDRDIESMLGVAAEVRIVPELHHPVTFGLRRPLVLLPPRLEQQSEHVRRAVLCHELLHVRRRDWAWLTFEECVRAALWFHPAIGWLVSRIQLAREELVDALVVKALGQRRAYIEALLAFSDTTPFSPAPAFGTRPHLLRRVQLISKETTMSPIRTALCCLLFAIVVTGGGWSGARALPLQTTSQGTRGPVEREARPITPENPVPRRTHSVLPRFPEDLLSAKLDVLATVNVTVDSGGRVVEHRPLSTSVTEVRSQRPGGLRSDGGRFNDAIADALRQWQYEPPFEGPITFPVSFRFLANGAVVELTTAAADTTAPTWHGGAARIGNGVLPPKKIKDVRPTYPPEAADSNLQGIVILEVRIEATGKVSHARVMRSIPALDEAAMDAVKQWEFEPAVASGVPTAVVMFVTVNFTRAR